MGVDPGSFFLGLAIGAASLFGIGYGWSCDRKTLRDFEGRLDANLDGVGTTAEILKLQTENEKLRQLWDRSTANQVRQRLELAKLNRAIRRRNAALLRRRELMRDAARCQSVARNAEPTEDGAGKLATAVGHVLSWLLEPALNRSDGFPTRFFFGLYSRDGCGRTGVVANGDLTIGELRSALMSVAEEINESVEEDRYIVRDGGGSKREGTPANDAAGPRAVGSPKVG